MNIGAILAVVPLTVLSPAPAAGAPEPTACVASWHEGTGQGPEMTASGEVFDPEAMTAAHESLPFDALVKVTRVDSAKKPSVVVRINDRWRSDRCINLSKGAFEKLAPAGIGVIKVRLEVL